MKAKTIYLNMSKQTKAAMWVTFCSFLQKGISFLTVPIFTRLLTTEEYGVYTLYCSWLSILTIITSLYIYNGIYDNALSKYENDRDRLTSSLVSLTIVLGLTVFCIYRLSPSQIKQIFGLDNRLMMIMFIEMLFTPAFYYWAERKRFEYDYRNLVIITITKSFLNPVLGLILVLTLKERAFARIISAVIVEIVFDSVILTRILARGRCLYNREYWSYGLKLAVPILPHYLSGMILSQGDRVMIDRMVGTSEVALYGVAYNIGMLVQIFVSAVNSAITPWMYKEIKTGSMESMRSTFKLLMPMIGTICIGLMLISPETVLIFGSKKYIDAAPVIPPVAGSVFFIFLYSALSFPQFYYEKTKFLMVASIIAAGVNVLLNWIFIQKFGFIAAGYTTLACYIVYSIGHYCVSKRILQDNGIEKGIIDLHDIILWLFIILAMCALSSMLFALPGLRYGLICGILLLAYINREKIVKMVKKIRNNTDTPSEQGESTERT